MTSLQNNARIHLHHLDRLVIHTWPIVLSKIRVCAGLIPSVFSWVELETLLIVSLVNIDRRFQNASSVAWSLWSTVEDGGGYASLGS